MQRKLALLMAVLMVVGLISTGVASTGGRGDLATSGQQPTARTNVAGETTVGGVIGGNPVPEADLRNSIRQITVSINADDLNNVPLTTNQALFIRFQLIGGGDNFNAPNAVAFMPRANSFFVDTVGGASSGMPQRLQTSPMAGHTNMLALSWDQNVNMNAPFPANRMGFIDGVHRQSMVEFVRHGSYNATTPPGTPTLAASLEQHFGGLAHNVTGSAFGPIGGAFGPTNTARMVESSSRYNELMVPLHEFQHERHVPPHTFLTGESGTILAHLDVIARTQAQIRVDLISIPGVFGWRDPATGVVQPDQRCPNGFLHFNPSVGQNVIRYLVPPRNLLVGEATPGVTIEMPAEAALMTNFARLPAITITERSFGQLASNTGTTDHAIRIIAPPGFRWAPDGLGAAVGGGRFNIWAGNAGVSSNVWYNPPSDGIVAGFNAAGSWVGGWDPPAPGATPQARMVRPPGYLVGGQWTSVNPHTLRDELIILLRIPARRTDVSAQGTLASFQIRDLWLVADAGAPTTGQIYIDVAFGMYRPGDVAGFQGGTPSAPLFVRHRNEWPAALTAMMQPGQILDWIRNHDYTHANWARSSIHVANVGANEIQIIPPQNQIGTDATTLRFGGITMGSSGTTSFPRAAPLGMGVQPLGWHVGGDSPDWLNRWMPSLRLREATNGLILRMPMERYRIEMLHPGVSFHDFQARVSESPRYVAPQTGAWSAWPQLAYVPGAQGRLVTRNAIHFTPVPLPATTAVRNLDFRFQLSVKAGAAVHGTNVEVEIFRNDISLGTAVIAHIYDPIIVTAPAQPLLLERDRLDQIPPTPVPAVTFTEERVGRLRPSDLLWVYLQATSGGMQIHEALGSMNLTMMTPPVVNTAQSGLQLRQISTTATNLGNPMDPRWGFVFEVVTPSTGTVPGTITFSGVHVHGPMMTNTDYHLVLGGPVLAATSHLVVPPPPLATLTDPSARIRFMEMPYSAIVVSVRGTHAGEQPPTPPPTAPPPITLPPAPTRPIPMRPAVSYTINELSRVMFEGEAFWIAPVRRHPQVPDVTLLANRVFAQFIDAQIHWVQELQEVTVVGYNATGTRVTVVLTVGQSWASIDGARVDIASFVGFPHLAGQITPLNMDEGVTYLPIRFMATAFGLDTVRLWQQNVPDVVTLVW